MRNKEWIYVFQCMWQINDKFKPRGVNQLFWMYLNEDDNSGILINIQEKYIIRFPGWSPTKD